MILLFLPSSFVLSPFLPLSLLPSFVLSPFTLPSCFLSSSIPPSFSSHLVGGDCRQVAAEVVCSRMHFLCQVWQQIGRVEFWCDSLGSPLLWIKALLCMSDSAVKFCVGVLGSPVLGTVATYATESLNLFDVGLLWMAEFLQLGVLAVEPLWTQCHIHLWL